MSSNVEKKEMSIKLLQKKEHIDGYSFLRHAGKMCVYKRSQLSVYAKIML